MMYRYKEKFALRFDDDDLMEEWCEDEENIFQWIEEESSLGMLKRGIKAIIQYGPGYLLMDWLEECFARLENKLEKEAMQELLIEILRYVYRNDDEDFFEMLVEEYSDELDQKLIEEITNPVMEEDPRDILLVKFTKQKGVAKYLAKLVNAETDCRFEESKLRKILYPFVNRCYRMKDEESHFFKDEIVKSLLMTKGSPAYQGYFDYVKNFIETNENSLQRLDNFGIAALPERRSVEQQLKDFVADVKEYGYDPKRGMECLMILQKLSRMHLSSYEELEKNTDVMEFLFTHFPKEYRIRYHFLIVCTDKEQNLPACKPWMELSLHMPGQEWEKYNEQMLLYMLEKRHTDLVYYCYVNLNLTERQRKLIEGYCFEIGEDRMAVLESYEWRLMDQFDAYIHKKGDWIQEKRLKDTYQTGFTWLWENKRYTLIESMMVKIFQERELSFCTYFLKNWMRILKPEARKGMLKEFPYMWARWLSHPELPTRDILSMGKTIGEGSSWDVFETYYKLVYETCGYIRFLELSYPEKQKLLPQLIMENNLAKIEFLYVNLEDSNYRKDLTFHFRITRKTDILRETELSMEEINETTNFSSKNGWMVINDQEEYLVSCRNVLKDDDDNIMIPEIIELRLELEAFVFKFMYEFINATLRFDVKNGRYVVEKMAELEKNYHLTWTGSKMEDIMKEVEEEVWQWEKYTKDDIQNAEIEYEEVTMYQKNGIELIFDQCEFREKSLQLHFWIENQSDQTVRFEFSYVDINDRRLKLYTEDWKIHVASHEDGMIGIGLYDDGEMPFEEITSIKFAVHFMDVDRNILDTTAELEIECDIPLKRQKFQLAQRL